jgi:hypothetical protein
MYYVKNKFAFKFQEESTEETETSTSFAIGKPCNRLGEDLLRMFLEEINPDVTIDVAGRRIRAHKCILSSRCQYFAAILSGSWIESTGNVISLQGYVRQYENSFLILYYYYYYYYHYYYYHHHYYYYYYY